MASVTNEIILNRDFLLAILTIVAVDIVLAGDNAVVIAMAVQSLHPKQRRMGILLGTLAAVVLRVIFTCAIVVVLDVEFLKLVGGLLIFWIAIKLLGENKDQQKKVYSAGNLLKAIWIIVIADVTMSLDNILAVGGAAKGNLILLLFGLGLSIPLVVFTSSLLSKLMDRFPIVLYIGAGVLGKVAGDMGMTDKWVEDAWPHDRWVNWVVEGVCVLIVLVVGGLLRRRGGKAETIKQPDDLKGEKS
ncbi:MAG: TerC family protein [Planctomycetes bacterium]|nr:TerC family protein [Planctomycetota bacterium]